jgi:preprotein translocase subunit SecD
MNRKLNWRIALTLLVALVGLVYVLPSIPVVGSSGLAGWLPDKKINLGLDLKGGIHLTLDVDVAKAMENQLSQMGQDIRSVAREEGVTVLRPTLVGKRLAFVLVQSEAREQMDEILAENFDALTVERKEDLDGGRIRYFLSFTPEFRRYQADMTVDQALKTIRNRIDQFGVAEPDIRKQHGGRIQIQLPGLQDPERAISIIGQTAHLEFRMVDEDVDPEKADQGLVPPGTELLPMVRQDVGGERTTRQIAVDKEAALTGEYITNARVNFDQFNTPYVSMSFNARGARIFERVTAEHVGDRMAIVLDEKVYSAPVIQDRIAGGRASITGNFSVDEATDLAIVLRAGSLPAPVNVLEQRTVGPSLGQESIEKGVTSALIGGALVLVFMLVYYAFAGLVADMVLILNIVLIMAGLAAFGATLTLPGIAGIILTIGMAVDANVIIFERIREEIRRGLTPRAAVDEGYSRATLTILDANVTTILAAVILYEFGTGPVRGFAVTLTLGILASLFTAIFVTRIMFDLWFAWRSQAKLSI